MLAEIKKGEAVLYVYIAAKQSLHLVADYQFERSI